ncbi:ROK family protein [Actinocorallia sp. A-T 12471]|uniref:ROK family protein n=1 Tax=Actinocorallia sp. A-T 12471 TaxID=3089813 RepID=UPI0029CE6B6F|nr:ROK family protein [Actinocorallia sp. A-T 12471]MDX6738553.1 ROK family protein [Actinocorallia sp. A-T 12471]
MGDERVLAIDIGGTKMAVGIVDPGGRVESYERAETPKVDAEGLWRLVEALLDKLPESDLIGVGVGCGGPMQWPAGEVSPLNMRGWRNFPLRARLKERYPSLPVRVHNDAVAVAVGEHWRGAGKGSSNVLGMVVSTGVGGGLILGGRLIDGASGNAGHIGHIVVDPGGMPCACGGRGCLEAIARGPALAAWAQAEGWRAEQEIASARDLAADAARGHPIAVAAMRRAGRALGIGIASATHLCDLDVVAIGGGLAQAGPLLFNPLEETFRAHARMQFARHVRVVPAALGQTAGLVGAAALVFEGESYWNAD